MTISVQTLFKKYRYFLTANVLLLIIFSGIAAYILFSRIVGTSAHIAGANYILRAFEQPFSARSPQIGIFPGLSILLWSAASFICLFSFTLIKVKTIHKRLSERYFLLYPGVLLGAVLLDEAFRFKLMLSIYLGIPKILVYSTYAILAFLFIYYFRREIKRTPYAILCISGVFFLISGLADSYPMTGRGLPIMLEDATKIFGSSNLALYFCHVCYYEVQQYITTSSTPS